MNAIPKIKRTTAANSLAAAQEQLQETAEHLKALTARRREVLLAGSDDQVAAIDLEIEAATRQQRTRADRVSVLLEAAEREAIARRAREQSALIERIEKKLASRDEIGAQLQQHIEAADKCFLKLLAIGREVTAAWPWQSHDLAPIMAAEYAVLNALKHELYRSAGRPQPGGGLPNPHAGPSWPGGVPEDLMWAQLPERSSRPLLEKLKEASEYASRRMRGDPAPATAAPPESVVDDEPAGPVKPPAELNGEQKATLRQLLLEQQRLSELDGPENDEAYRRVGEQISQLSNQGA